MTGDADEPGEALVASTSQRLDGAAPSVRDLPFVFLDEVVELDEIDVVDAHARQRALEAGPCLVTGAVAGLCGQEHVGATLGEERRQAQLRFAVGGGGVDVVDAVL